MLLLSAHHFFKANSNAKEVVSKLINFAKKDPQTGYQRVVRAQQRPLPKLERETRLG